MLDIVFIPEHLNASKTGYLEVRFHFLGESQAKTSLTLSLAFRVSVGNRSLHVGKPLVLQQRLENFPIPGNPQPAPAALGWRSEPEMTRVTLLESPTSLWSWARAVESIAVGRAEPCTLLNSRTRSCRMVNNSGKWWEKGFFLPPAASHVGQSYQGSAETGWGGPVSASSAFALCLYMLLLSGINVFCIPDRDNEIH